MPMDYVVSTIALGFKLSTLLVGAMFFSGGMWTAAHSVGLKVSGDSGSLDPAISANGRFVAFESNASDLVFGDHNARSDIFLHDLHSDIITRVSVDDAGFEANGDSVGPVISRDGRFVAFESHASNLQRGVTASGWGIYIHDRLTLKTFRAHLNVADTELNDSGYRRISDLTLLDDDTIELEVDLGRRKVSVPVRVGVAGLQRSLAT